MLMEFLIALVNTALSRLVLWFWAHSSPTLRGTYYYNNSLVTPTFSNAHSLQQCCEKKTKKKTKKTHTSQSIGGCATESICCFASWMSENQLPVFLMAQQKPLYCLKVSINYVTLDIFYFSYLNLSDCLMLLTRILPCWKLPSPLRTLC